MGIAQIKASIKSILNDDSHEFVEKDGRELWVHDWIHLDVAKLPPIELAGHMVDGISGIPIPEFFPDQLPEAAAYDGMLDEVRVGLHHWFTRPEKVYSWVILANYYVWMLSNGVNPVAVTYRHWKSMH